MKKKKKLENQMDRPGVRKIGGSVEIHKNQLATLFNNFSSFFVAFKLSNYKTEKNEE